MPKFSVSKHHKILGFLIALALIAVPATVLAAPPETSISAVMLTPTAGASYTRLDTISYTNSVTHTNCAPSSYEWRMGDSTKYFTASASHTYASLGTFSVNVKVVGECGKSSTSASVLVTITNIAPTVNLAGPASGVAGEPVAFTAAGSDADGTIVGYLFTVDGVAQPQQPGAIFAPVLTSAGQHTISVIAVDNNGGQSVAADANIAITAASYATMAVSGPVTMVAASSATFDVVGADAFGNEKADSFVYNAPQTAGAAEACFADGEVGACAPVDILADVLDSIAVTGPSSVVAGKTANYEASGADQFGNAVPLATSELAFEAPTQVGVVDVCMSEGAVQECLAVTVVADVLASIDVRGTGEMVVGTQAAFTVHGFDQYGNDVALEVAAIEATAPTLAGMFVVSYEENGVLGVADVLAVADELFAITVSGPERVAAGSVTTFDVAGVDQYGNEVVLDVSSFDFTAPLATGDVLVAYTEGSVTGSKLVGVDGVTLSVDVDLAAQHAVLAPVNGVVSVIFPGGPALEGVNVELVFTHTPPLGDLRTKTVTGVTNADGTFAFRAPFGYELPGTYDLAVSAAWMGNTGTASRQYIVGL